MIKLFSALILSLFVSIYAYAATVVIADQIKSADRTKTWTMPAATGTLATLAGSETLTNKTISGASNTLSNVNLASQVTGNLPVTNLGSGTGASATTFWRGDGTWATPSGGGGGGSTTVAVAHLINPTGHGATATKIRTFGTILRYPDSTYMTITQDTTNGDKITINTAGRYAACYGDTQNGALAMGITVNDSATTTNVSTPITYAQGLRAFYKGVSASDYTTICDIMDLSANDILRAHTDGTNSATDERGFFYVFYVGAAGDALYLNDGNGFDSTNGRIKRYTSTRENTGSSFTVADNGTDGTRVTVNSDGTYWICVNDMAMTSSTAGNVGISVNGNPATDIISLTYANGARGLVNNYSTYYTQSLNHCIIDSLNNGDVIRSHHYDTTANNTDSRSYLRIVKLSSKKNAGAFKTGNGYASVSTVNRKLSTVEKSNSSMATITSSQNGSQFIATEVGLYVGCGVEYSNVSSTPAFGITFNNALGTTSISTPTTYGDGFRGYKLNSGLYQALSHCAFDYLAPGGKISMSTTGSGGVSHAYVIFFGGKVN